MVDLDDTTKRAKRDLFHNLRRVIRDEKVLSAMEQVPRELFVPPESKNLAYKDAPLPIGQNQTISQPFIVAVMTSALELRGGEKVMEVGTGCGYQAAILSLLVPRSRVLTLERFPQLKRSAENVLRSLGYCNVDVNLAGGTLGCPGKAPYDAIIVTAAAPKLPPVLLDQMPVGGRMVIPIGTIIEQELVKVVRTGEGHTVTMLGPCRFVPLIGPDAWPSGYENS